jgi:hypothetical protein
MESVELTQPKKEMIQESAVSYLDSPNNISIEHENILPEPPTENSELSIHSSVEEEGNSNNSVKSNESDWLSRMECNNH